MPIPAAVIPISIDTSAIPAQFISAINRAQASAPTINLKVDSRPLGKISNDLREFDKSLAASNARVIAFGATTGVLYSMVGAFQGLIRTTIDVEKRLQSIQVILGASSANFAKLKAGLFDIAGATGQTFQAASEAAEEFSRQGLSLQETLGRTKDALVLARQSGLDFKEAVVDLTAAVNTFRGEALDTATVVDKFANVDANFAVSSKDLADSIARAGAVAKDAKVSFDQLLAATTAVQQATARGGAVIGNAFKSIFSRVERPATLRALEDLGVATRKLSGETLPVIDILGNLAQKYQTLSESQRQNISSQIAGNQQINIAKALLSDLGRQNSVYAASLEEAGKSSGAASRRNEELNQTLSALLTKAQASGAALASAFGGRTIEPALKGLLTGVNSFFDKLKDIQGSDSIGARIGKGIIDGIGGVIKGPGAILLGAIFLSIFGKVAVFAKNSVAELAGLNKSSRQQEEVQNSINKILNQGNAYYKERINNAQGLIAKEEVILQIMRQENALLQVRAAAGASLAAGIFSRGVTGNSTEGYKGVPRVAGGYIPNAADGLIGSFLSELSSIKRGVGGAGSSAKPVVVPNFSFGGGKTGTIVANSDEYIVKNYGGGQGSAVFNQRMLNSVGGINNLKRFGPVQKIAAGGFVPNFRDLGINQVDELLKVVHGYQNPEKFGKPDISLESPLALVGAVAGDRSPQLFRNTVFSSKLSSLNSNVANFRNLRVQAKLPVIAVGQEYQNYKKLLPHNFEDLRPEERGEYLEQFLKNEFGLIDLPKHKGRSSGSALIDAIPGPNTSSTFISQVGRQLFEAKSGFYRNSSKPGFPTKGGQFLSLKETEFFKDQKRKGLDKNQSRNLAESLGVALAGNDVPSTLEKSIKLALVEEFISGNFNGPIRKQLEKAKVGVNAQNLQSKLREYGKNIYSAQLQDDYLFHDIGKAGGFLPNFAPKPFESMFGSALLDIRGKTASIDGLSTYVSGQGHSRFVYQDIFEHLKDKGVKQVTGTLLPQFNKSKGKDASSAVKAMFPQIIRAGIAPHSILGLGRKEYKFTGQNFQNELGIIAPDILREMKDQGGSAFGDVKLTSFLAGGHIPNFANEKALKLLVREKVIRANGVNKEGEIGGLYNSDSRTIEIVADQPISVLTHELAHDLDRGGKISNSKKFQAALAAQFKKHPGTISQIYPDDDYHVGAVYEESFAKLLEDRIFGDKKIKNLVPELEAFVPNPSEFGKLYSKQYSHFQNRREKLGFAADGIVPNFARTDLRYNGMLVNPASRYIYDPSEGVDLARRVQARNQGFELLSKSDANYLAANPKILNGQKLKVIDPTAVAAQELRSSKSLFNILSANSFRGDKFAEARLLKLGKTFDLENFLRIHNIQDSNQLKEVGERFFGGKFFIKSKASSGSLVFQDTHNDVFSSNQLSKIKNISNFKDFYLQEGIKNSSANEFRVNLAGVGSGVENLGVANKTYGFRKEIPTTFSEAAKNGQTEVYLKAQIALEQAKRSLLNAPESIRRGAITGFDVLGTSATGKDLLSQLKKERAGEYGGSGGIVEANFSQNHYSKGQAGYSGSLGRLPILVNAAKALIKNNGSFANGFLPNFLNPLKEAIGRETKRVGHSDVYVDSDARLRNSNNPLGLLVANKRDEPSGGFQGVNRAIREGRNPNTYGAAKGIIPNFAPVPPGSPLEALIAPAGAGAPPNPFHAIASGTGFAHLSELGQNLIENAFATINIGQIDLTRPKEVINKAIYRQLRSILTPNINERDLARSPEGEHIQRFLRRAVEQTIDYRKQEFDTQATNQTAASERRNENNNLTRSVNGTIRRLEAENNAGREAGKLGSLVSRAQAGVRLTPEEGATFQRLRERQIAQGLGLTSEADIRRYRARPANDRNYQTYVVQAAAGEFTKLNETAGKNAATIGLGGFSEREQERDIFNLRNGLTLNSRLNKYVRGTGLDLNHPENAEFASQVANVRSRFRQENRARIQQGVFGASFALPIAAQTLLSASRVDPDSRKGKIASGAVEGASTGLAIASLAPTPLGIGVATAVGGFLALRAVTTNLAKSFESISKEITEQNNKRQEETNSISALIQSYDTLVETAKSGPGARQRASSQFEAVLASVPGAAQGKIRNIFQSGNFNDRNERLKDLFSESGLNQYRGQKSGILSQEILKSVDDAGSAPNSFLGDLAPSTRNVRAALELRKTGGYKGKFFGGLTLAAYNLLNDSDNLIDPRTGRGVINGRDADPQAVISANAGSLSTKQVRNISDAASSIPLGNLEGVNIDSFRNRIKGGEDSVKVIKEFYAQASKTGDDMEAVNRAIADFAEISKQESRDSSIIQTLAKIDRSKRNLVKLSAQAKTGQEIDRTLNIEEDVLKDVGFNFSRNQLRSSGTRTLGLNRADRLLETASPTLNDTRQEAFRYRSQIQTSQSSQIDTLGNIVNKALSSLNIPKEALGDAGARVAIGRSIQNISNKPESALTELGNIANEIGKASKSEENSKKIEDAAKDIARDIGIENEKFIQKRREIDQEHELNLSKINREKSANFLGGDFTKLQNYDYSTIGKGFGSLRASALGGPLSRNGRISRSANVTELGDELQKLGLLDSDEALRNRFANIAKSGGISAQNKTLDQIIRRANQAGQTDIATSIEGQRGKINEAAGEQASRRFRTGLGGDVSQQQQFNNQLIEAGSNRLEPLQQNTKAILDSINSLNDLKEALDRITAAENAQEANPETDPVKGTSALPNGARGFVPNFNAFARELREIRNGVGGARMGDSPLVRNINGLGNTVVNSGETIIRNFLGGNKDAVFNRDMVSAAGGFLGKFGRIENLSKGLIPNFAFSEEETKVQEAVASILGSSDVTDVFAKSRGFRDAEQYNRFKAGGDLVVGDNSPSPAPLNPYAIGVSRGGKPIIDEVALYGKNDVRKNTTFDKIINSNLGGHSLNSIKEETSKLKDTYSNLSNPRGSYYRNSIGNIMNVGPIDKLTDIENVMRRLGITKHEAAQLLGVNVYGDLLNSEYNDGYRSKLSNTVTPEIQREKYRNEYSGLNFSTGFIPSFYNLKDARSRGQRERIKAYGGIVGRNGGALNENIAKLIRAAGGPNAFSAGVFDRLLKNGEDGSAIDEALDREARALYKHRGIPYNLARGLVFVGQHPSIGTGVGNYLDEPNGRISPDLGVLQGVTRVITEGGNPRNAGAATGHIPNFAEEGDDSELIAAMKALTEALNGNKTNETSGGVDVNHAISASVNVNVGGAVKGANEELTAAINEALANFKSELENKMSEISSQGRFTPLPPSASAAVSPLIT